MGAAASPEAVARVHAVRRALRDGDMAQAKTNAAALLAALPADPDARSLAASVAMAAGDYRGALALMEGLPLTLDRRMALLVCYAKLKDVQRASEHAAVLLEARPGDPDVLRWLRLVGVAYETPGTEHLAYRLLRAGKLARGFGILQRLREASPRAALIEHTTPEWKGQRVRHLVISNADGAGDGLMFLRFTREAAAHAERTTLCIEPALMSLYRHNGFEVQGLYGARDLLDTADAHIDAQALPAVLPGGPSYGQAVYLRASTRHDFGPGFHVGVNWTASEGSTRSVPADMLAPLAGVPGVTFHNLVFGHRAAERPAWVQPLDPGDFLQTAGIMAGLDLVVTVDSSPFHLAGSLGVPVWVALPTRPAEWRFSDGEHSTPWYPAARLFRGPQCFEAMAAALDAG